MIESNRKKTHVSSRFHQILFFSTNLSLSITIAQPRSWASTNTFIDRLMTRQTGAARFSDQTNAFGSFFRTAEEHSENQRTLLVVFITVKAKTRFESLKETFSLDGTRFPLTILDFRWTSVEARRRQGEILFSLIKRRISVLFRSQMNLSSSSRILLFIVKWSSIS